MLVDAMIDLQETTARLPRLVFTRLRRQVSGKDRKVIGFPGHWAVSNGLRRVPRVAIG